MKKKAILLLDNGVVFEGESLGKIGESIGEVCFNTGMTGYQEILTDPSYFGQHVTLTYPHIGNYGINESDTESSKPQISGLIVKEACDYPSNYRSTDSIDNYLINNNIIAIQKIDTRKLTKIIRSSGSMNGIISSKNLSIDYLSTKLKLGPSMVGLDLAKSVSCTTPYSWKSTNKIKYKVAVFDFGIKNNILNLLSDKKCDLTIFPCNTKAQEILQFNPDGIFLSNGPGDPAAITYAINEIKKLIGKKPIFGICLGHQILALALGAKTYKLKFGHRGCNHPVRNLLNNKVEITSQNHGFAIDENSIPQFIKITHKSLNDNTIEGIICKDKHAFSVQYHPESSPGPHDSRYLFNQFIDMMDRFNNA